MTKWASTAVLAPSLQFLVDNVKSISLCAGAPANYSQADTTGANVLAKTSVSSAIFSITTNSSGLILVMSSVTGITVSATGVADHLALYTTEGGTTALYFVTELATQALPSTSNTVNLSSVVIGLSTAGVQ